MKKYLLLCVCISFGTILFSQNVGIGTLTPDASAQLDIVSTSKGLLLPRVTTAQRSAITTPANSLLVYDTDTQSFWYYNGIAWTDLAAGGGSGWLREGNAGTSPLTDFVGTTDDQPLYFRINNTSAGFIHNSNFSTAFGLHALAANTSGHSNTALGFDALQNNTTGRWSTAIGLNALKANTGGQSNTAVGVNSLTLNETGSSNVAIGNESLRSNTTGSVNVAIGVFALENNTTGFNNTAVGMSALRANTTGQDNTVLGVSALGFNTTGNANTALGRNALRLNTEGGYNTAAGYFALMNNTTGLENAAFGTGALEKNTEGDVNTALGRSALFSNTTGNANTASGFNALNSNTTGSDNAAYGTGALEKNTEGLTNTAIGRSALFNNTSGAANTSIGKNALDANTTGNRNTSLGNDADVSAGNLENATAIGANALVAQSNSLVLGSINGINGATADTRVGIGTTVPAEKLDVAGNIRSSALAGGGTKPLFADNNGVLTTGGVSTTTFINVAASDFVKYRSDSPSVIFYNGGASHAVTLTTGASDALYAPVHLPHGSTIVSMKFVFHDESASNDIEIELSRTNEFTPGGVLAVGATIASSGTSPSDQTITSPVNHIVDNNYTYYLTTRPATGSSWQINALRVKGVVFEIQQ